MTDVIIVGPGAIGKAHVQNFRRAGATVVALAGRNHERTRAVADELGVEHAFEGHRAALEKLDAEIVSVATPPQSHADITIDCVREGRHVLCEKPFAMNAVDARAMVLEAEKAGVLLGCWSSRHQFLWGLSNALAMAGKGEFGEIVQVHIDFQWRDLVPGISFQPECRWFLDSSWNGGGVLADWGSYWIDMALAFIPEANPVSVIGSTFLGMDAPDLPPGTVRDAEELAISMITFDSGASVVLQLASRVHQEIRHQMRVWGTQAGCRFNPFDAGPSARIEIWRRDGNDEVRVAESALSMHDGPAIDFVSAVGERREPAAPGHRAARVVEITDAIYESARSRRPVNL